MRDWIIYFVDTGNSLPNVLRALTGGGGISSNPDCPVFDPDDAKATLQALIADRTLACGPAHGWDEYLIVRAFMPRTAERLSNA